MSISKKHLFAMLLTSAGTLGAGLALARLGVGSEVEAHMRSAIGHAATVAAGLSPEAVALPAAAMAHLAAAATAMHPWIALPLTWIAAPFLAAASMSRAVHGEPGERLAFGALAVACFGFAFENLLIAHSANGSALDGLANTRLQLSAMSNFLLCAFPLLICFRLPAIMESLKKLKDVWNYVIPVLGSAGLVAIAMGPSTPVTKDLTTALANDEIISTAAWIASGAALTGWSRKYGICVMISMGLCACAIAVPQFNYYAGNVLLHDLMRVGGTVMALIIALAPLPPGNRKDSEETGNAIETAEPATPKT